MLHRVKELQFKARASRPDPRLAGPIPEQFGSVGGDLAAAMQHFKKAHADVTRPDRYVILADIATDGFSHLEIVGPTIQMLLKGVNAEILWPRIMKAYTVTEQ